MLVHCYDLKKEMSSSSPTSTDVDVSKITKRKDHSKNGIRRRDSLDLIRQPVNNKSAILTEDEIKRRYQDTALVIFKEQQQKLKDGSGYLQYGTNRKGAMYSNYGNNAVVVHRKNLIPQSQICAVM